MAQRTGNADWNPKLQANVQSMQLDEMEVSGVGGLRGFPLPAICSAYKTEISSWRKQDDEEDEDENAEWRTDGPFKMGVDGPGMSAAQDAEDAAVAVCEKAIQLVAEYGAQGAMIQVMYAAKKQLERELRDLEHSEGVINVDGGLEEEREDPEWRDRVKDQMQLKELERQLAAVDEETVRLPMMRRNQTHSSVCDVGAPLANRRVGPPVPLYRRTC